tara:strand:- start:219 stop:467 length:249 start_codon:yes stop_codon:yes gene_type:complete
MSKLVYASVKAKECNGNVDKMIRKFMKKVKKERIIEQVRDRRFHKKPSVKKREKRIRAERARKREEAKRQRRLKKQMRNYKK